LIWRIRARNDAALFMRVSLRRRITVARRWIFLLSLFLRDWRRIHYRVADARVGALCVNSRTERKNTSHNCCKNFQIFDFHTFVFRKVSQPAIQMDVRGGKFKKDLRSCFAIRPAFSSLLN